MQAFLWVLLTFCAHVFGARYDASEVDFNLNQNQSATHPLDYYGEWSNHTYNKSPSNWRFPFYTLLANGDPLNDNANGTLFEQDILSNQFRHGGDVSGLLDSLDYLQGMGIKGLYIAGSPFINQPWTADSYSPLDLTILDHHFGTIDTWRTVINAIHARGMYVVLDNTFATLGDLVGFEGYLNTTTPFVLTEHKALWKSSRRYLDFDISNDYNATCSYPRFWNETGRRIDSIYTDKMNGCYNSELDQYGDTEAFGVYPDFQRQLTKFASVQDRLRDWHPPVLDKIIHFSCIVIRMLDIDGFRFDKALQITVDAQGTFGQYMRNCARSVGKENFFMPGEITGGNTLGSIYLGRGRQPDMLPENATVATMMNNNSDSKYFIRDQGMGALDAAAFHYTIYRSLTRFLGMDGNLEAGYDANGGTWTQAWNTMLLTNDMVNENTGVFDPRHMFGVTNQDVFRWPAISQGTERMILGMFITAIHLPGIPLVTFGEEQAFYVLDSTADNYIYGRQPMTSSIAWQLHGCYSLGSTQYYQMPLNDSRRGCEDDTVSYDHRDPSHPVRNILKHMYYLREQFPVLNDGWYLQDLSNQTRDEFLPGSSGKPTQTGIWSVVRKEFTGSQSLPSNQSVWFVYHNVNETTTYTFDCTSDKQSFLSAFDKDTTAKNLFYPFDEVTLGSTTATTDNTGCLSSITMKPYEFKAYVPKAAFVTAPPMITKFSPGHDARIKSAVSPGQQESIDVEIQFSSAMSCDSVTSSVMLNSTTEDLRVARVKSGSVQCSALNSTATKYVGGLPSVWTWKATLENVSNGIHAITVRNATQPDGTATNSVDRFLFRTGQDDNPMVFPQTANYTRALLHTNGSSKDLYISHKAAGADKWKYSLTWGSTWSDWEDYRGGNESLQQQNWTGTDLQKWQGTHIMAQYWSKLSGSSAVIQHADLGREDQPPRRFPHLFFQGPYNQYGFDAGLDNKASLKDHGAWDWHFMTEWPDIVQMNVWGINPDGQPDASFVYGDIDVDGILDRLPPSSLSTLAINVTRGPPSPWLAWKITIDDGTLRYTLLPVGNRWQQLLLFILLALVPLITGCLAVWGYMRGFYDVKFNEVGVSEKHGFMAMPLALRRGRGMKKLSQYASEDNLTNMDAIPFSSAVAALSEKRRTVLIATLEYDIDDWNIKIKIGGLGVMAQLMGKNLEHQDLIWVVPCVGGVDYPPATQAEPMEVTILGEKYEIQIQTHQLRNITYVLLDAPIFRAQSKTEPYPPRMDDLDSAVYYSAWNQCIAKAIQRYPVDLYHINDYHGACAPLYLLPETIPCCLSLHNAEFQGLWPMRTPKERAEVCSVFNLSEKIVAQYVQFGSVFNLLHAGASYLRVHQKGVGAVGVSNKYGKRSWARYPIFWGLKAIGKLPNPDPTDTEAWDKQLPKEEDIHVDPEYEAGRAELKRQAQEWAGLEQRADAELFVFVGRWSVQKGVDLIADVFPAVLEHHEKVQLICIGPVIDLYGKFAALKLGKMMEKYPGRVYSKPEFTALPPYIFSGAEFALIPSRDEPFGLVAVEFGRKGALGVGARVGGLGQMPGWWYTVESTTSAHLLKQFKGSIDAALASSQETRAMMRARSAKQRFPVQQWKEDLGILQSKCIKIHDQEIEKQGRRLTRHHDGGAPVPPLVALENNELRSVGSPMVGSPAIEGPLSGNSLTRTLSLGVRRGPGHRTLESGDNHPHNILEDDEYFVEHGDQSAGGIINPDLLPIPTWPIRSPGGDNRFSTASAMSAISFDPQRASTFTDHPGAHPSPAFLRPHRDGTESPGYYEPDSLVPPSPGFYQQPESNRSSLLSLNLVVGEKKDFNLQKVDPFFTDSNLEYFHAFESKLGDLNGKTSEHELCIEEFLIKSERSWFGKFRDARLGRMPGQSMGGSRVTSRAPSPTASSYRFPHDSSSEEEATDKTPLRDEFLLGDDYKPPTGLKKYAQMKIGDWPLYTLLLAIGQIISANSYQVTLLTGTIGQAASKLYTVASIYLVASIGWWILFRRVKAVYCLSIPFIFYGLAFLLLGLAPFIGSTVGRGWVQNAATGVYAAASASGCFFFSLNFGDEGGAPVKDWIYRACIIQGTQQTYNAALWYWGTMFTASSAAKAATVTSTYSTFVNSWKMTAVVIPIAVLMWTIGYLILVGLPSFYRQAPGAVPSFYSALGRRKIVVWTLVAVLIQNFFLSSPYGRNWQFLWSSRAAPKWAVALLLVLFFVVIWAGVLFIFARLSKSHSWIVPIFAIGLGAPRWCQMLWSTSNVGLYLPWAGNAVSSALVSRALWLWLGLLDIIQGVGFGMIFLQTLTRIHVAFTLVAAQVLGSVATMVARAVAPNNLGPGDVFPDISRGSDHVLGKAWFWTALVFQLIVCAGYLTFFRKEQLNKP
ncbi:hypothetical protein FKW77_002461 [Venturia effusa]|uniref:alpha-1,3-glucan synthase n=1 Tax=Venturia effusa TaxID=50376 RepID=A0A517L0X2_9PEZI|nr:hypothetical protein FKW77_002461 [Venturia effusa]